MASTKAWSRLKWGALTVIFLLLAGFGYLVSHTTVLSESTLRADIAARLAAWSGGKVDITGPVRLHYFPALAVTTGPFRIESAPNIPQLRSIEATSLEVDLGFMSLILPQARLRRITLTGLDASLRAPASSKHADTAQGASADQTRLDAAMSALRAIPIPEISIADGVVEVSGPHTSETFTEINASASVSSGGMLKTSGSVKWRGQPVSFDMTTTVPDPKKTNAKSPLRLSLSGPLVSADVDGDLTAADGLRATGALDLRIEHLRPFARWLGLLIPDGPGLGQFLASGGFSWTDHRLGFDEGTFTLDGNRSLGTLTLDFAGIRPLISGTLAFSALDLTPYGLGPAKTVNANSKKGDTGAPAIRVDFPLLHHLNLDLRLSTSTVVTPALTLGQVAMSATVRAGRLTADFAILDLCGGNGNGRVDLDATVPESTMRLTGNFNGVAARKCLQPAIGQAPLSANLDLLVDVSSKGRMASMILRHLDGKVDVKSGAGTLAIDLAALKTLSSPVTPRGWAPLTGGSTAFSSLSAELIFRGGRVFASGLKIRSDTGLYSGDGTVDLLNETLDFSMLIRQVPKMNSNGEAAQESSPKTAATLTGPWLQPVVTLRKMEAAAPATTIGTGTGLQVPAPVH